MSLSILSLRRPALAVACALIAGTGIPLIASEAQATQAAPAAAVAATPVTFACANNGAGPGAVFDYVVPADVNEISVVMNGAKGGGWNGGYGGLITTVLSVQPNQTLKIAPGCQGTFYVGGWGGAGAPGSNDRSGGEPGAPTVLTDTAWSAGGGGATQIIDLAGNPLAVAGGGGASMYCAGGWGASPPGVPSGPWTGDGTQGATTCGETSGTANPLNSYYGAPGGFATQSAVGAAGAGNQTPGGNCTPGTGTVCYPGNSGAAGSGGRGGNGGVNSHETTSARYAGGGGGGGWFGGGGGGGGGCSHYPILGCIQVSGLGGNYGYGGDGSGGSSYVTQPGQHYITYGVSYAVPGQVSITPAVPPTILNSAAKNITGGSVDFSAQAVPTNWPISGTGFRYTTDPLYGSYTDVIGDPTSSDAYLYYSASVFGLTPGTTYYYQPWIEYTAGTHTYRYVSPVTQSFMTAKAPAVTNKGTMTYLTAYDSTLVTGTATTNGLDTLARVEYSTSSSAVSNGQGTRVTTGINQPLSGTTWSTPVELGVPITGLQPNTTYFFRFHAENGAGSDNSPIQSFKTAVAPANVTPKWPSKVVVKKTYTYKATVRTFSGAPLSGTAVVAGTDFYNRRITVCKMKVTNGSGSCKGKLKTIGKSSILTVTFTNGYYAGDTPAKYYNVKKR